MCHVTPPKFGNASSRFVHYPDSVQYTCDTGYWLDGPTTANCTSDGTLTTTPKCKGKSFHCCLDGDGGEGGEGGGVLPLVLCKFSLN